MIGGFVGAAKRVDSCLESSVLSARCKLRGAVGSLEKVVELGPEERVAVVLPKNVLSRPPSQILVVSLLFLLGVLRFSVHEAAHRFQHEFVGLESKWRIFFGLFDDS